MNDKKPRAGMLALQAALVCGIATSVVRADDGPYLTAGYGITAYETRCNGDGCDRRDSGFRTAAGWQLGKHWSAEASYFSDGRFVASDSTSTGVPFHGNAHVHGSGATIGYDLPIVQGLSFGGRVGAAAVKAEFTPGPAPAIGGGRTTAQLLTGLNARWRFTDAWSLRLDWDHTRAKMNRYDGDVNMLSVGVQFGFRSLQ